MAATDQEVQDAFQELYDNLTDAYWAASTIVDKDRIRGMADAVYDILTALTQADFRKRSEEYAALQIKVESVSQKLQKLQTEIDGIIHNIKLASKVAAAITKVVGVSATLLA